jgi:hypothetical protein
VVRYNFPYSLRDGVCSQRISGGAVMGKQIESVIVQYTDRSGMCVSKASDGSLIVQEVEIGVHDDWVTHTEEDTPANINALLHDIADEMTGTFSVMITKVMK